MLRFEAIRSGMWDYRAARLSLVHELTVQGEKAASKLRRTTKFWKKDRPVFKVTMSTGKSSDLVSVEVTTDNPIYSRLDQGVEGYVVNARGQSGHDFGVYSAGSTPNSLNVSRAYEVAGAKGVFTFTADYYWPGIEARNFYETAKKELEDEGFVDNMQTALDRTANKWIKSQ